MTQVPLFLIACAFGAVCGGLFFGSLQIGVALLLQGKPLRGALLQVLRMISIGLALTYAARWGAAALLGSALGIGLIRLWIFARRKEAA